MMRDMTASCHSGRNPVSCIDPPVLEQRIYGLTGNNPALRRLSPSCHPSQFGREDSDAGCKNAGIQAIRDSIYKRAEAVVRTRQPNPRRQARRLVPAVEKTIRVERGL